MKINALLSYNANEVLRPWRILVLSDSEVAPLNEEANSLFFALGKMIGTYIGNDRDNLQFEIRFINLTTGSLGILFLDIRKSIADFVNAHLESLKNF